jgi:hypothetical protein
MLAGTKDINKPIRVKAIGAVAPARRCRHFSTMRGH